MGKEYIIKNCNSTKTGLVLSVYGKKEYPPMPWFILYKRYKIKRMCKNKANSVMRASYGVRAVEAKKMTSSYQSTAIGIHKLRLNSVFLFLQNVLALLESILYLYLVLRRLHVLFCFLFFVFVLF